MTFSQYSQLKEQIMIRVSTTNKHNRILLDLKEYYKDDINSPRRNERIQTIGQLLLALEIRDILSENNVKPLKEIAKRVENCGELLRKINEFESIHIPTEPHNYYDTNNTKETKFNNKQKECYSLTNPYANVGEEKKQTIQKTVVQQIGVKWRDLARNLKVPECRIDEIEKDCATLNSKAKRLMEIYKQSDPQKWVYVLCESLERARRKDLAKKIQKILVDDK